MPAPAADLLTRYREIDGLLGGSRRSPEFRRWQASTAELLRKALGFHPAVVQFQGLRFRAGPVGAATPEELAAISDAEHDRRMHQDLGEAKRLLRGALGTLGLDPDAPEPGAAPGGLEVAVAALGPGAPAEAASAARRLALALAAPRPAWSEVEPELGALLRLGLPVARAALSAVGARLADLR